MGTLPILDNSHARYLDYKELTHTIQQIPQHNGLDRVFFNGGLCIYNFVSMCIWGVGNFHQIVLSFLISKKALLLEQGGGDVKTLSANATSGPQKAKLTAYWDIALVWFGFMSEGLHALSDPALSVNL